MLHPRHPRRRTARAVARRADASAAVVSAVGTILLLMLVWGGMVAAGVH